MCPLTLSVLSLLWVTVLLDCGVTVLAIVGGRRVPFSPFYVRIEMSDPLDLCGGTLVAPDLVVTAAHCFRTDSENRWVDNEEVTVLKGVFSQRDWWKSAELFSVERYVTHEKYDPRFGTVPFDLAVAKLDRSVDMKNPANALLPPCEHSEDYREGLFMGMGLINRNPLLLPSVIMGVNFLRDDSCGLYSQSGKEIDGERQVCYRSTAPHRGSCDGDSGGPLVYQDLFSGQSLCFIGVSSFGSATCGDPRFPTVFASASFFYDWIHDQATNLSQAPQNSV